MSALTTAQKDRAIELAYAGQMQIKICEAIGCTQKDIDRAADSDLIFQTAYARALDRGLDGLGDSLVTICEDESIPAHVLRQKSDNIKWLLARRASKRYGDRLDINVTQQVDIGGALIEARKRSHLLPSSNHVALTDAQDTEYTELIAIESTGSKPVAAEPGEDPDIFA